MAKHSQNQRERLSYLEFRVSFTGQISRGDLVKRFGISEAAATRDLALYREEVPGNLEFDSAAKIYRIGRGFAFYYLKHVEPNRLLLALVHGIGDDFGSIPECLIPCELPAQLRVPPAEILAAVSRSIAQKAVLQMEYLSETGNHGTREIVPFSLVSTGLKWMVRGYCRHRSRFSHFVLSRIKNAEVLSDSEPKKEELKEHDDEWNRMLKLELIPHPAAPANTKAMTEQEFQMIDGAYILRVRAALAGFVLRLWSVDCSEGMDLKTFPLSIRNRIALHDVDNSILAPGYKKIATVKSNTD